MKWMAILTAASMGSTGGLVHAQEPLPEEEPAPLPLEYQVELIVFEYTGAGLGTTEDWRGADVEPPPGAGEQPGAEGELERDAEPGTALETGALSDSETPPESPTGIGPAAGDEPFPEEEEEPTPLRFAPAPEEALELGGALDELARSADYRPLVHTAWRQPGYPPEDAPPLDLARVADLPARLGGTATLFRSRFLHLRLQLELAADTGLPDTPVDAATPLEPVVYRLGESRKMRRGELHYFDHPRFGVLVKVTMVEPEPSLSMTGGDLRSAPDF